MITQEVSQETLSEWKALWERSRESLKPNRKSGPELLEYLQSRYPLTEIFDENALEAISGNVTMNSYLAEKLPEGASPQPKAFYLENSGSGARFYLPENQDDPQLWGGEISRIFVGIDLASGFYMVEGSTLLWDELCAFQGLDSRDLEKFVMVAEYLNAQKRLGLLKPMSLPE